MGGRIQPDLLAQNLARNLGLTLDGKETASKERGWLEVMYFFTVPKSFTANADEPLDVKHLSRLPKCDPQRGLIGF